MTIKEQGLQPLVTINPEYPVNSNPLERSTEQIPEYDLLGHKNNRLL